MGLKRGEERGGKQEKIFILALILSTPLSNKNKFVQKILNRTQNKQQQTH